MACCTYLHQQIAHRSKWVLHALQGGGVRVNNERIDDENRKLESADLIDGKMLLLAAGKKNKLLLHVS